MHSLIINIDKDRIITQDMKYESRHWPTIKLDPQVQESFTIWAANKDNKAFLDGFVFREWNQISFVWFIGTPWKSAMILGIRIAGTNRDFFVARDAHPFSVSLLRKPLDERSNMCDVKKNRGLCFLCALLLLALSYFYATWKKKTSKNDSLLGPMVIFTPWEQKEPLYSYCISRCSFACLIHRTSQHQG